MRVHATLTIKVVFDDAESLADIKEQLQDAAQHLASEGFYSDYGPAIVDTWEAKVEVKKEPR